MSDPETFLPLHRLLKTSSSLLTPEQNRVLSSIFEAKVAWRAHGALARKYKQTPKAFAVSRSRGKATTFLKHALRTVIPYYSGAGRSLDDAHNHSRRIVVKWHPELDREFSLHFRQAASDMRVTVPRPLLEIMEAEAEKQLTRRPPIVFPTTQRTYRGSSRKRK